MVVIDHLQHASDRRKPARADTRVRTHRYAALVLCLSLMAIDAGGASAASCLGDYGEAAVEACQQVLNKNPNDVDARLKLADTLVEMKRYKEAVDVLNQGVMIYPGSSEFKRRLSVAKSFLEEQQWIEKQRAKQSAQPKRSTDTAMKLNLIRCGTLKGERALAACEAGLEVMPDDAGLLAGRADALVELNRLPEAIRAYQRALSQDPGNADLNRRLKTAEGKRQLIVAKCLRSTGTDALAACDESLLKGAADQAAIETRRAELLLETGQKDAALEAYRRAETLDPGNAEITRAIAALTQPKPVVIKPAPREATVASVPKATKPKPAPETPKAPPAPRPEPEPVAIASESAVASVAASQPKASTVAAIPRENPSVMSTDANERQRVYSNAPLSPGVTF